MTDASTPGRQVVDLTPRRSRMLGPLQLVRACSSSTGSARGVLNVLASYADADTLVVYVGRSTLARQSGLSRSTLRRAVRDLEAAGEVVTLEVGAGDRPSRYRLTLSPPVGEPVDNPTVPERERVHPDPGEGSQRTRGRVHSEPQPGLGPVLTGRGSRPRACSAHASVDNPPPCRRCQELRLAAEAADRADRDAALDARRCPHGRLDGDRITGRDDYASRVCPACEVERPAGAGD